jgi:hypothetical protein
VSLHGVFLVPQWFKTGVPYPSLLAAKNVCAITPADIAKWRTDWIHRIEPILIVGIG